MTDQHHVLRLWPWTATMSQVQRNCELTGVLLEDKLTPNYPKFVHARSMLPGFCAFFPGETGTDQHEGTKIETAMFPQSWARWS